MVLHLLKWMEPKPEVVMSHSLYLTRERSNSHDREMKSETGSANTETVPSLCVPANLENTSSKQRPNTYSH